MLVTFKASRGEERRLKRKETHFACLTKGRDYIENIFCTRERERWNKGGRTGVRKLGE